MQSTAIGRQNKFGPFTKLLRIMKVSALLLLLVLQAAARPEASAQVTLKEKSASLEKVLKAIKKQSDYGLVFDEILVRSKGKPVMVDVINVPVETALAQVFKTQDMLTYTLNGKIISIKEKKIATSNSQVPPNNITETPPPNIDVHGVVKDETGKPVVGASVLVKGTNKGTTTNDNGEFVLIGVNEKATLVISAVNIETREVGVNGRTELSFTAKAKISKLEDVEITNVNTGYQSIPKERATGSFTQVDNKTLNLQVGASILSRLESVTSAVAFNKRPGNTGSAIPALTVRGLSTINGPSAPLIVLDNFPFEGDINSINPNLIESVTILNDATAASIWGTRAGNGVIVINTKKAKFNQPIMVDFRSSIQVVGKPDLFYFKSISTSDFIDVEQMLYSKGYYTANLASPDHPAVSPLADLLDKQSRGIVSAALIADQIAAMRNIDIRNEYRDKVYQNAVNKQYALSFSGGSDLANWSVNTGYDHNISDLSDQYDRKSVRFETNFKPIKKLTISSSLYLTGTDTKSGKIGYTSQTYIFPYNSLWDKNGNAVPTGMDYRMAYTDTLGGGKLLDWNYYAADEYKHSIQKSSNNNLIANLGLQYQLGSGFSVDFKYQYEGQQIKGSFLRDDQSYYSRNYVNQFSQINPTTGVVTYIVPRGGFINTSYSDVKANNIRSQINYAKRWGKHQLIALAGNEIRSINSTDQNYYTLGYDAATASGIAIDNVNRYPIITNGQLSNLPFSGSNTFNEKSLRFVSFYGNASYTYNNKYSITISGRRDASNLFGVNTNNKWTPLWSVGASWDIAKESFYKLAALSYLKLRATYGYTGNADPSRAAIVTVSQNSLGSTTGLPSYIVSQFPNPSLRWEQVAISNIGIDFGLRNKRLSGSLEWYQKNGIDLFGTDPIDISAGVRAVGLVKNVSNMVGNGFDMSINSINTNGKLIWSTGFIFNYNTDKVTKAFTNATPSSLVNDGSRGSVVVGLPVFSVIYYKWAGLDKTGNPQGYLNGQISTNYSSITGSGTTLQDLDYVGQALPKYFGSISNSFRYKKFELNFNISYKLGYVFGRKGISYASLYTGQTRETADFSRRWQNPGDEAYTDVPVMVYPSISGRESFYNSSSALVEKGDHIRLQFINLSYTKDIGGKNSVGGWTIQLNANASNLGILWRANNRGIDPDYVTAVIPPSKAYTLSLKISKK